MKINHIIRDLSRDADVDHPIHEVEGEEHDGEDDSAVLVNITGSHAEYPCWWLGQSRIKRRVVGLLREEGGVTPSPPVTFSLVISWQGVLTVIHCAGQHAARVEPHTSLEKYKRQLFL